MVRKGRATEGGRLKSGLYVCCKRISCVSAWLKIRSLLVGGKRGRFADPPNYRDD